MTSFYNRFKSLATGFIALSFFAAVTVGACTSKKGGSQESEKVEHPASAEHPTDTQAHPSDSVSTKSEHPSGSEHPSDSEHPNN